MVFCLTENDSDRETKTDGNDGIKGKAQKKGKLREIAKKQFRFWTNIKYSVPCQHVNFIRKKEASSGHSKWSRVACSSPRLTETQTNQPTNFWSYYQFGKANCSLNASRTTVTDFNKRN